MADKVTPKPPLFGLYFALIATSAVISGGCANHDSANHSDSRSIPITHTASPGYRIAHLNVPGGVIDLETPQSGLAVNDEELQKWVLNASRAVSTYFGRFPVTRVHIIVSPGDGDRDVQGVTTDESIEIHIRHDFSKADLDRDWVLTHEMFHLAFPDMDRKFIWLQEGLASYLEPLARSRVGLLSTQQVWSDWVEGMPQGQPEAGDMGLNNTHTWGRTYWGGSMFCLQADLRIREKTQNRKSLDDAMRAILNRGGDRYSSWTIDRVLQVGDDATGTNVLHDVYAEMAERPLSVDLDALWKSVGVEYRRGRVTFNDNAPLAKIRASMTTP